MASVLAQLQELKRHEGPSPLQHEEVDLQVPGAGSVGHGSSNGQILWVGGRAEQQPFGQTLP